MVLRGLFSKATGLAASWVVCAFARKRRRVLILCPCKNLLFYVRAFQLPAAAKVCLRTKFMALDGRAL